MLNWSECDCIIGINSGILAESASIDSSNSIDPVIVIGKKGIINQVPNGPLTNEISISYYPEIRYEPNFQIISFLKNLTSDYDGINVEIGGVIARNCYLKSYSLKNSPNEITKASVNFISYLPLSGTLLPKSGDIFYNKSQTIGHGWTTFITTSGEATGAPTYEFNYDFDVEWEPIYLLGQTNPTEVKLMGGSEKIEIVRDAFYQVKFSGEIASGNLIQALNDNNIDIMSLGFLCSGYNDTLAISISGGRVKNSIINYGIDDIIKISTTINKYF